MNPQLKMLVWKEWRERRGEFALSVCCVFIPVMWMVCEAFRHAAWKDRDLVAGLDSLWLVLYGMVMPIFIAMRTVWGEATDRTAAFSQAMPLSPRRAVWIRLAGGAVVLAIPLLLLALILPLLSAVILEIDPGLAHAATISSQPLDGQWLRHAEFAVQVGAVAIVGCYVQLALLGTLVRGESQLALLGAVWTTVWMLVACLTIDEQPKAEQLQWFSPQALLLLPGRTRDWALLKVLANAVLSLVTAWWFAGRQSRGLVRRPARSRRLPRPALGLGPIGLSFTNRWPKSRLVAVALLAARQTLPICLAGLAIALALTISGAAVEAMTTVRQRDLWNDVRSALPSVTSVIGILWASIVGVGTVSDELDRRTGDFWRSQPIPFWMLFTVKFAVGLFAVVLVLDGPVLLSFWIAPDWRALHWRFAYAVCLTPLHAAMFAIALAWACWLRKVALGAMAAVVSYLVFFALGQSFATLRGIEPFYLGKQLFTADIKGEVVSLAAQGYPAMAVALVVTIAVSFWIAGRSLAVYQPRGRAD